MIRFLSLILALGLSIALVLGGLKISADDWSQSPQLLDAPVDVNLEKGTPLAALAATLESRGLVSSALVFRLYIRMKGSYSAFQAGSYRFEGNVSPSEIETAFTQGKIYTPIVASFTIPEGFTMKKIANRLAAKGIGKSAENLRLMQQPSQIIREMAELQNLKIKTLEGFLYPATYNFPKMPSPKQAVTDMVAEFFRRLPRDYEARASAKRLSLVEAVTFASLIELETLHEDEKPLVSEVIWARLRDGVPLGIDAALIYGIDDYQGDVRWKDLGNRNNRFNTRIFKGLPPTPIGSVTIASLEAVLAPASEGNYYYVLKPGPEQRHHFSKSLSEHNHHVRNLVKSSKSNKEQNHGQ